MRWSLKIAKLAGIDIFIHFTFFILVTWVAFIQWKLNGSIGAAFSGVVFILAVFACVVLHELGHALAARKYGIRTQDIILLPIGGVARLEKMPDRPIQELWVALAGPAVNVVIAALLAVYLWITNTLTPDNQLTMTTAAFVERIMGVNIFLILFNMLPAFPMDGGRVLRALLLHAWHISGPPGFQPIWVRALHCFLVLSDCFIIRYFYSSHFLCGWVLLRRPAWSE